jgi:retinol-binding protein 3
MSIVKQTTSFLLFYFLLIFAESCNGQQNQVKTASDNLSQVTKSEIVSNFQKELQANYIFPDLAFQLSSKLDSVSKLGSFNHINDPNDFADRLSAIIKATVSDNHLGIKYKPNYNNEDRPGSRPKMRVPQGNEGERRMPSDNQMQEPIAFKILNENIGYLKLDVFDDQPIFFDKIDEVFAEASKTKSLIIDLRSCRGGSPTAENYVISYFFNKETQFSSIFQRQSNAETEQTFLLVKTNSKKYVNKPVYILTGEQTFSSAENFAYDMQTLRRATIVGVKTKGGANPGREFSLGHSFYAFIPTGRSYSYLTKTNWEGVGIQPDILVKEDMALEKALVESKKNHDLSR